MIILKDLGEIFYSKLMEESKRGLQRVAGIGMNVDESVIYIYLCVLTGKLCFTSARVPWVAFLYAIVLLTISSHVFTVFRSMS